MEKPTIHELIHILEEIEEAYGEGQTIENIEWGKPTANEPAQIVIDTGDAVFERNLDGNWE